MILIVGNYISNNIKTQRELPSFNPAGSNRMFRLATAIQQSIDNTLILSPGSAAKIKFNKKIIHKATYERRSSIDILYSPALAIPYVSVLWEQISFLFTFINIAKKAPNQITGMLIYCYYPSSVIISLVAKYFYKVKIIEDCEDVCEIRVSDFKFNSHTNGIQQLVGYYLMKIIFKISVSIIIPTEKYKKYLPSSKAVNVITGCVSVPQIKDSNIPIINTRINILFGGSLEIEHGSDLLLSLFQVIDDLQYLKDKFSFFITGFGDQEHIIKDKVQTFNNVDIKYYGFVSDEEYQRILFETDICLVLQKPDGRYASSKTPSKGYEYLANGKVLIISNIGDFSTLPSNILFLLDPYSVENLITILSSLTWDIISTYKTNAYQYAYEKWSFEAVGKILKKVLSL